MAGMDPVAYRSISEMVGTPELDGLMEEYARAVKNRKPKPMPTVGLASAPVESHEVVPKVAAVPLVGFLKMPLATETRKKDDTTSGAVPTDGAAPAAAAAPCAAGAPPCKPEGAKLPSQPSRPPGFGTDCLKDVVSFSCSVVLFILS